MKFGYLAANIVDLSGVGNIGVPTAGVVLDEETGERGCDVAENSEGIDGKKEAEDAAFETPGPVFRTHGSDDHGGPPESSSIILEPVVPFKSTHTSAARKNYQERERDGITESTPAENATALSCRDLRW